MYHGAYVSYQCILDYLFKLVGARDGRTQSAPTCLFFFFFQQILVLTLGSPLEKGGRKKKEKPWY